MKKEDGTQENNVLQSETEKEGAGGLEPERTTSDFSRPCPVCGEPVPMSERVCPHCGYYESKEGGYKPMTKIESRRIKTVLFFVFMAAAVFLFIMLRYS